MPKPKEYVGPKEQKRRDAEEAARRNAEAARAAAVNAQNTAAQARYDKANDLVKAQRAADQAAQAYMAKARQIWNAQIDAIVNQIVLARKQRNNPNLNAGNNPGGPNTLGGNTTDLVLVMPPGNTTNVTKAAIIHTMTGLQSSDSGVFKFKRQDVLVHCK